MTDVLDETTDKEESQDQGKGQNLGADPDQVESGGQDQAEGKGMDKAQEDTLRQRLVDKSHEQTTIRGHDMDRATLFKFIGLLAFLALMVAIVVAAWPYLADIFTEGGVNRLVERVRNAGPIGVFILLGLQFLQVVVAFIPGEVVQLVAGLMYGPVAGTAIILVGCVISSSIIYQLVHKLGAPFVQGMVSTEHLEKFRQFEKTGKLDVIVFVLFLIPGLPKDVFTYVVPLTDMDFKRFIGLTTLGRIPGVLASTYTASGLASGQIVGPIIVVAIVAVLAVLGVVFREKIMDALGRR